MRRPQGPGLILGTALIATLLVAGAARAQVFYQYPGAPVVSDTEPALGFTAGIGDDLLRLVGYGRFNVSEVSDLGLELVLDHWDPSFGDDGWRIGAGADFRYAIVPANTNLPFDLSLDGGLGLQTGSDITSFNIPVGAVISRPLELQNGRILTPYGGLYLLFSHISVDTPPGAPDYDDSDFDVELRLGTSLEIVGGVSGFVSAHVGNEEKLFLGLNASL
jgi:hypothetical protein